MGARSLILTLTLFLGTTVSLKGAQASTAGDECLPTDALISVEVSALDASMYCHFGSRWTIGNDLCDPSSFTLYSGCNTSFCYVNASDYHVKGPTYVCCHGESQTRCNEIIITPTTTHQVPPVLIAGRTEKVYTIITSKPRPADTAADVIVELLIGNPGNSSIQRLMNASTKLVSDPTNATRYIAIHTFDAPVDFDGGETGIGLRFQFTQPPDWTSLDLLVPPVVPIVAVSGGGDAPTQPTDMTTEGGEIASAASTTCLESGKFTAIVVVGTVAVVMVMVMIIGSVICCTCVYRRMKKNSYAGPPSAPNDLPLPPLVSSSYGTNSVVTTPGVYTPTPMSDSSMCSLLPGPRSTRGTSAVSDPAVAMVTTNPASFLRQQSRESSSTATTTTPTDGDKLLSASAAVSAGNLTVSTGLVDDSPGTTPTSTGGGCSVHVVASAMPVVAFETGQSYSEYPSNGSAGIVLGGGDTASMERTEPTSSIANIVGSMRGNSDPRFHTYATLGEVRQSAGSTVSSSFADAAGGQSLSAGVHAVGGSLLAAYYNRGSSVPLLSLSSSPSSSMGTMSSLISPPLPSADPNYSTGGRKMHLDPQCCDQPIATDV